jgi:hypothetical protein
MHNRGCILYSATIEYLADTRFRSGVAVAVGKLGKVSRARRWADRGFARMGGKRQLKSRDIAGGQAKKRSAGWVYPTYFGSG